MKIAKIAAMAAISSMALNSCNNGDYKTMSQNEKLATLEDSVSYNIGKSLYAEMASNLERFPGGMESLNKKAIISGFVNAIMNDSTSDKMNEDQTKAAMTNYFKQVREKEELKMKSDNEQADKEYNENVVPKYEAEGFKKIGPNTNPRFAKFVGNSEVMMKVTAEGKGASVTDTSFVLVNYTGKLLDGKVFDSTDKHGRPAPMNASQLIPGFSQAMVTMKENEKATIVIPSSLGYGNRAMGDDIPANSTLVFDVEIVKVFKNQKEFSAYMEKMAKENK
ncbi:MAG: FKBP-type peptidyl-prolyl cis-trans isomerase [Bacteroidales bacterium]|nr:FKBP-type peptidyl-prolyl cis-trans isomerase [Candidatus Physcocola equi]